MSKKGFPKDVTSSPFDTYDKNYENQLQEPFSVFSASRVAGNEAEQKRQAYSGNEPTAVSLPPHLFIPHDAQSVDIRNLVSVPPLTTVDILRFKCPKGSFVKFLGYGVFFDALQFDLINLVPTVNGVRVFPFHGNPQAKYKIGLGLGSDLNNANLIQCQLDLQPEQEIIWTFTNNDVVDVVAGVRMAGYVDQSTERKIGRFGG